MEISIDTLPESVTKLSVDQFNVKVINSIKEKHKSIRQASKSPTFALT